MEIRVMGDKNECNVAAAYYRELEKDPNVKLVQVSKLYPNRGSSTAFRLYVKVEYHTTTETVNARQLPSKEKK